jgi:hypothetical protein
MQGTSDSPAQPRGSRSIEHFATWLWGPLESAKRCWPCASSSGGDCRRLTAKIGRPPDGRNDDLGRRRVLSARKRRGTTRVFYGAHPLREHRYRARADSDLLLTLIAASAALSVPSVRPVPPPDGPNGLLARARAVEPAGATSSVRAGVDSTRSVCQRQCVDLRTPPPSGRTDALSAYMAVPRSGRIASLRPGPVVESNRVWSPHRFL